MFLVNARRCILELNSHIFWQNWKKKSKNKKANFDQADYKRKLVLIDFSSLAYYLAVKPGLPQGTVWFREHTVMGDDWVSLVSLGLDVIGPHNWPTACSEGPPSPPVIHAAADSYRSQSLPIHVI